MSIAPADRVVTGAFRDAFSQSIVALGDWQGGAEPWINLGQRSVRIDEICRLAAAFNDEMTDLTREKLRKLANGIKGSLDTLPMYGNIGDFLNRPVGRTYASGARCLLAFFEARKNRLHASNKA